MIAPAAEIGGLGELEIPIAPPLPDRLAAELQESADFLRGPPFVGFGRIVRRGAWRGSKRLGAWRRRRRFQSSWLICDRRHGTRPFWRHRRVDASYAFSARRRRRACGPEQIALARIDVRHLVRERNAGRVASIAALIAILFRHHAAQN